MTDYPSFGLFLTIGLAFGPLAGLAAFLITYEEYSHHGLSRSKLLGESLAAAAYAAAVMVAVVVVAGYFIGQWGA